MSVGTSEMIGLITEVANALLLIVGAVIAWFQWRKPREVTRSEHLRCIVEAFKQTEFTLPFYCFINNVSYGGETGKGFYEGELRFVKDWPTDAPLQNNDIGKAKVEVAVDRMLMLLSEICHERDLGVISEEEFRFFDYQIGRTLAHKDVKRYLFDFAEYCGKYRVGYPFLSLVKEGVKADREMYGAMQQLVTTRSMRIFEYIDSLDGNHRGQIIDESVGEIELTCKYGSVNRTDVEVAVRMHNIKQKH